MDNDALTKYFLAYIEEHLGIYLSTGSSKYSFS